MAPEDILTKIRKDDLSKSEKILVYNEILNYCTPEGDFFTNSPFSYDEKGEIGYWIGQNEYRGTFGEVEHCSNGSNEGYWAGIAGD